MLTVSTPAAAVMHSVFFQGWCHRFRSSIVLLAFMFTLGKYILNINDESTVFDLLFIYIYTTSFDPCFDKY